jgi:hypothetical protein
MAEGSHARTRRSRSPGKDSLCRHLGRSRLSGRLGKYSGGAAGWTQCAGLQIEYNLIERTVEREIKDLRTLDSGCGVSPGLSIQAIRLSPLE